MRFSPNPMEFAALDKKMKFINADKNSTSIQKSKAPFKTKTIKQIGHFGSLREVGSRHVGSHKKVSYDPNVLQSRVFQGN